MLFLLKYICFICVNNISFLHKFMSDYKECRVKFKKQGDINAEIEKIQKEVKFSQDRYISIPNAIIALVREGIIARRMKELENCK